MFIKLHQMDPKDGLFFPIYINYSMILRMVRLEVAGITTIEMINKTDYMVRETEEDIINLSKGYALKAGAPWNTTANVKLYNPV